MRCTKVRTFDRQQRITAASSPPLVTMELKPAHTIAYCISSIMSVCSVLVKQCGSTQSSTVQKVQIVCNCQTDLFTLWLCWYVFTAVAATIAQLSVLTPASGLLPRFTSQYLHWSFSVCVFAACCSWGQVLVSKQVLTSHCLCQGLPQPKQHTPHRRSRVSMATTVAKIIAFGTGPCAMLNVIGLVLPHVVVAAQCQKEAQHTVQLVTVDTTCFLFYSQSILYS